jgi:hypothetical protein
MGIVVAGMVWAARGRTRVGRTLQRTVAAVVRGATGIGGREGTMQERGSLG